MRRVLECLSDPVWWFTAVVIAIVASTVGAFLRDAILSILAKISYRIRVRKEQADARCKEEASLLSANPLLLILSVLNAQNLRTTYFLMLVVMCVTGIGFFCMPKDTSFVPKVVIALLFVSTGIVVTHGMGFSIEYEKMTREAHRIYREKVLDTKTGQSEGKTTPPSPMQ